MAIEPLSPRLLEAICFAALAHEDQFRKYPEGTPYIAHACAVALVLARCGYDEDVVIAGLLHDVIEDTNHTPEEIEEVFGTRVKDLVMHVSEDWRKPAGQRKNMMSEHLKHAPPEARAISLADLLANRVDILMWLRTGGDAWSHFVFSPDDQLGKDEQRLGILREGVEKRMAEQLDLILKDLRSLVPKTLQHRNEIK
jgi:hypothetical protein